MIINFIKTNNLKQPKSLFLGDVLIFDISPLNDGLVFGYYYIR